MSRSLAIGLSLAVVLNATPLRAQQDPPPADEDATADAVEDQDPLSRLAAMEMEAADFETRQETAEEASDPARDPRAWRALAQARLTHLARVIEAYRHPAQFAAPGFKSLTRKIVPQPLQSRMGDRRQALDAIYGTLAVMDYARALRHPQACPSAPRALSGLLYRGSGLFADPKTRQLAPWTRTILSDVAEDAEDVESSDAQSEDADEASDAVASESYDRLLARAQGLSAELDEVRGAAEAGLRCARAAAWAGLAKANRAPAEVPAEAADAADQEAQDAAALPSDSRRALAQYLKLAPSVVLIRAGSDSGALTAAAGSVIATAGGGQVLTRARAVIDPTTGKPFASIAVHFMPEAFSRDLAADAGPGVAGTVVAADMGLDLALVSVSARPEALQALRLGDDAKVRAGDPLFAIGHPEQGGWWALTMGAAGRARDDAGGVAGRDLLRTSAGMNRGNYGGPLFNLAGEQIGMVLPVLARDALGRFFTSPDFALRASAVKRWLSRARSLDAGTVEETPVAQEAAAEDAAEDADSEDPVGEGSILTVAAPYSLDGLITLDEDSDAQADEYADAAEQAADHAAADEDSANAEDPEDAGQPEDAAGARILTPARPFNAESLLRSHMQDLGAADEDAAAGDESADQKSQPARSAPAPAPRPAPAPPAPQKPAGGYTQPPRPAPAPAPKAISQAPKPKAVPRLALKPVTYVPPPAPRAPARPASGPSALAPRRAPATPRTAPTTTRPAPVPVPKPIPKPQPPAAGIGGLTPFPPGAPRIAPGAAPAAAAPIAVKPGAKAQGMGRLEPFPQGNSKVALLPNGFYSGGSKAPVVVPPTPRSSPAPQSKLTPQAQPASPTRPAPAIARAQPRPFQPTPAPPPAKPAKTPPASTPKPATKKTTGVDPTADIDAIVQKSPTMKKIRAALVAKGYAFVYGPVDGGTGVDKAAMVITVDSKYAGKDAVIASLLAHEFGHTQYKNKKVSLSLSRDEYVKAKVADNLADEGEATLVAVKAARELGRKKVAGVFVPGVMAKEYEKIYAKYPAAKDREKARREIGTIFSTGETASIPVKGASLNYKEYYTQGAEREWDAAHPKPTP